MGKIGCYRRSILNVKVVLMFSLCLRNFLHVRRKCAPYNGSRYISAAVVADDALYVTVIDLDVSGQAALILLWISIALLIMQNGFRIDWHLQAFPIFFRQ